MPVAHDQRFVFVHVQKTGGMSVTQSLRDAGVTFDFVGRGLGDRLSQHPRGPDILATLRRVKPNASVDHLPQDHLPASVLREFLGDAWNGYYKFAFVRNPWDLVVSRYTYLKRDLSPSEQAARQGILREIVRRADTFEVYVRSFLDHALDMSAMLLDETGADLMDFTGRFENIEEDFARICKRIGVAASLVHINASERTNYANYYTPRTQAIVARRYARDIDRFSYRF